MNDHPALGEDLGRKTVDYNEADAILYALAIGAPAADLELVFERDLKVLPTYGLVLSRWAMEEVRLRGYFDAAEALHGSQTLEVLKPLPSNGSIDIEGRVVGVWDKGHAAVFDVETSSEYFRSTASVFAFNRGGWGGPRGSVSKPAVPSQGVSSVTFSTSKNQAALYRLTGDPHLLHIDPRAAKQIGQPRPILHGLCTLGFAVRHVADVQGSRPYELTSLSVRFSKPALPGDILTLDTWEGESANEMRFQVRSGDSSVLKDGFARF